MNIEADVFLNSLLMWDVYGSGSLLYVAGKLDIRHMQIMNHQSKALFKAKATKGIIVEESVDCGNATGRCLWVATGSNRVTVNLWCARGTGLVNKFGSGQRADSEKSCLPCMPSHMQLIERTTQPCALCPDAVATCEPGRIILKEGYMSPEVDNIINNSLRIHHCPNPHACPGGQVPRLENGMAMCRTGHVHDGCLLCNRSTHGAADADALSCTRCATSVTRQTLQLLVLIIYYYYLLFSFFAQHSCFMLLLPYLQP